MTDRRSFLYRSLMAAAGSSLLGCSPHPKGAADPSDEPQPGAGAQATADDQPPTDMPYLDTLGIQLWTVRDRMAADPAATLRALAEMGYRQVELMDTRHIAELKPLAEDVGLRVNSSFMQWSTITDRWDLVPNETTPFTFTEVLDQTEEGGLSHLIFGYLTPGERETADDWRRVADRLNEAAAQAKDRGIQMAYHNHNFEWVPVGGTTGFDILTERLDGDLVPFELDVAWVAMAGRDPRSVMESIGAERIELLHAKNLQDLGQPYLTIEEMPEDKFEELGDGVLDIPGLMRLAKEYGVTYCIIEQDNNFDPDSLESAKKSIDYLKS